LFVIRVIIRILFDLNLLECWCLNLLDLGLILFLFLSELGLLSLLLFLADHTLHAVGELQLHVIVLSVGTHQGLKIASSLLKLLLHLISVVSPVQSLFVS